MIEGKKEKYQLIILFLCFLALTFVTVYHQSKFLGREYLMTEQLTRHRSVIDNTAPNPYQYRVMSCYVIELLIKLFDMSNLFQPELWAFIFMRLVQNMFIFWLSYIYYRRLKLNTPASLVGISILAFAMTHCLYDSDMQFNTYSDLIFYLTAGVLILNKKDLLVVFLMLPASLNRETSALIPVMLLMSRLIWTESGRITLPKKALYNIAGSVAVYAICYVGLRFIYGGKEIIIPYDIHPGIQLFSHNLTATITWINVLTTLSILPIIALISLREWPYILKRIALAIVPLWIIVHFFMAIIAETRMMLVPLALVLIPGAMFGSLSMSKAIEQ